MAAQLAGSPPELCNMAAREQGMADAVVPGMTKIAATHLAHVTGGAPGTAASRLLVSSPSPLQLIYGSKEWIARERAISALR